MVDARVGGRRDLGLGAVGDAEAGRLQHREIVGAVADGERVVKRRPIAAAISLSALELGVLAEDRLDDLAGQLAAFDHERVGAVLVGAEPLAIAPVNWRKPPETMATWAPFARIV